MKSLGIELYVAPSFNIQTGNFDPPKIIDADGREIKEEDMDIFELAKLRGTTVNKLKELNSDA